MLRFLNHWLCILGRQQTANSNDNTENNSDSSINNEEWCLSMGKLCESGDG